MHKHTGAPLSPDLAKGGLVHPEHTHTVHTNLQGSYHKTMKNSGGTHSFFYLDGLARRRNEQE